LFKNKKAQVLFCLLAYRGIAKHQTKQINNKYLRPYLYI